MKLLSSTRFQVEVGGWRLELGVGGWRLEVGVPTPTPLPKSLQKSSRFFNRFCIDLGSILDPTSHPKIVYVSSNFALGVALGPSWRQEGAQSAPGQLRRSIFLEFGRIWDRFGKIFPGFLNMF